MRLARTASAFLIMLFAAIGHAQSPRTFLASTGNDLNPCSLASPCRSFQTAVNAVAAGGEVVVLDSAGYGVMTISGPMTVEAPNGIYAGVTVAAAGTGAIINTAAGTDVVVLRGLTFTGGGVATRAIDFIGTGQLHVESCLISGFGTHGILLRPGYYTDQATIENTIVRNSGFAIGVGGAPHVTIDHCSLENSSRGLYATNNKAPIVIRNSVVVGNAYGISISLISAGNDSVINVENCLIAHSTVAGVDASGAVGGGIGVVRVSNSTIVFNVTGLSIHSGGEIDSFGNNKLSDNTTPGSFTGTIPQQ